MGSLNFDDFVLLYFYRVVKIKFVFSSFFFFLQTWSSKAPIMKVVMISYERTTFDYYILPTMQRLMIHLFVKMRNYSYY